jgi:hypothetical protein
VRDVRGWVTSVLDMILRKRLARRHLDLPYSTSESMYLEVMSGGRYDLDPNVLDDDRTSIAPLMRYWAEHMTRMPAMLPSERTLVIRTRDIAERLPDLAAHVGVPVDTMRIDLAHANRAPMTFDRFAAFGGDEVRQVYEEHCSAVMAEVFPEEHAAWSPQVSDTATRDWAEYVTALDAWVAEAIELHGMAAAR